MVFIDTKTSSKFVVMMVPLLVRLIRWEKLTCGMKDSDTHCHNVHTKHQRSGPLIPALTSSFSKHGPVTTGLQ